MLYKRKIQSSNDESLDFPFHTKYGNITPSTIENPKRTHKLGNLLLHQYNNELPEIFRLTGMNKSNLIYNNPHLEEIPEIRLDGNKIKMEKTKKLIHLLGKIKKNPKLSQDAKVLESITAEEEIEHKKLYKVQKNEKGENVYCSNSANKLVPKLKLPINSNNLSSLLSLNHNFDLYQSPKNVTNSGLVKQIDENSLVYLDENKRIKCSKHDLNKLKELQSIIDVAHSSYIGDINNYHIKECCEEDDRSSFIFERKPMNVYNPILHQNKLYKLPPFKIDKWDKYSEAFHLMNNKLYKKGGLFSESIKMNKLNYKAMFRERKEKLNDRNSKSYKNMRIFQGNKKLEEIKNSIESLSRSLYKYFKKPNLNNLSVNYEKNKLKKTNKNLSKSFSCREYKIKKQ